jgi:hypothetical protein
MAKHRTSLEWHPTGTSSPCKIANEECIHKHENVGRCRFTCSSYDKYEELRTERVAKINDAKYKQALLQSTIVASFEHMNRRRSRQI